MSFNWIKKGLIFNPANRAEWMMNYAQVPTVLELEDKLRIYFTTRPLPDENKNFVSHITFVDVDKKEPLNIINIHDKPVLELGKPGTFDQFGTMPAWLLKNYESGELFLYYTGWNRLHGVPYSTSIGLAISNDEGISFAKYSEGPILGQNINDPVLMNGPSIIYIDGVYHMWYSSATRWIKVDQTLEVEYLIKHATSSDAINWKTEKHFCLTTKNENESQNAPRVIKLNEKFYMFYCYRKTLGFRSNRNSGYRLGMAVSSDLKHWERLDEELNLDLSNSGWDSEMMAYPFPLIMNNKLLLFYNGNYFGKEGFGYAETSI